MSDKGLSIRRLRGGSLDYTFVYTFIAQFASEDDTDYFLQAVSGKAHAREA